MSELKIFLSQPKNTRILLLTSLLYAFVLPIVDIFVAAYIMRNSADVARVVIYQGTVYAGIPITFLINGYLLNAIKANYLYAFGMILSGISMLVMISLPELNYVGIGFAGIIMGMSFGFFWANRDYLVLVSTNDDNRNYYYGVETFFNTFTFVIVPITVGFFIQSSTDLGWVDSINGAYRQVIYLVIAITLVASYLISKSVFESPRNSKFLYFKYNKVWYRMIHMALLKGLMQGFIVTAPAMLVMKLVGEEGALGVVQSVSSLLTALLMYVLGRIAKPENRIMILGISLALFVVGSLVNSIFFNAASVVFFLLCMIVARPMFDFAYFPIQMRVIDYLVSIEHRNEYAYILNHEIGLFIGRFIGCGIFILLALYVSDKVALVVTLPLVSILQGGAYFVAKRIDRELNNCIN